MMVPGIYEHWLARDRKSTSWLGSSCNKGFALVALSKYLFGVFIFMIRWFQTTFISMGVDVLTGHCMALLCKISLSKGILGPIGGGLQV